MTAPSAPPNWSHEFLKTMVGVMILSPIVGALLYLVGGQTLGHPAAPLDTALQGAKTVGLIGGFAAPLIALGMVAREINQRAARGESTAPPPTED